MLAIDTNILVRLLVDDEPAQTARARALVAGSEISIATTVVLEAAWVLKSSYGMDKATVTSALRAMFGVPNLQLREPHRVKAALDLTDKGMDIADALHLAAAEDCEAFITFDRNLAKLARSCDTAEVREP